MTGILACHNCKRRKIKCDRQLPECAFCRERSQKCEYPTEARKPGPKPGTGKRSSILSGSSDKHGPLALHRVVSGSTAYPSPSDHLTGTSDTTSPVNSFTSATPESTILYRMIHPNHDAHSPIETEAAGSLIELGAGPVQYARMVGSVCTAFDISPQTFETLLAAYFDNMTAYSLFHRPTFDNKMCAITSEKELQALLAAMFSFSVRFVQLKNLPFSPHSQQLCAEKHFAEKLVAECIADCKEDSPSLCVLQAMTINIFISLTNGVRGRSWRALGECIRIAFELRLHQVDRENAEGIKPGGGNSSAVEWVLKEERRRLWWAIWELDVFASTIKCLPTGISWRANHTCLPVDDALWYSSSPTPSCWLADDPSMRCKVLERSGNRGGCAWFIVANSLMRNAQMLPARDDPVVLNNTKNSESPGATQYHPLEKNIIENSVACLIMALPAELDVKQGILAFTETFTSDKFTIAMCYADCARYSIHMMIQLSRIMTHRHEVFWHAHRILRSTETEQVKKENFDNEQQTSTTQGTMSEQRAWNHYLDAANSIVELVRSSSPKQVQHVNPMLANTIWLAAAAQVLCTVFGPDQTDRRTAKSNLELLRTTFKEYVSFWGIDPTLQERLDNLETSLQNLRSRKVGKTNHTQRKQQSTVSKGTPSGMEKLLNEAPSPVMEESLDHMILTNDLSFQMSPFDAFTNPGDTLNPFTLDLDELFAFGYP